MSQPFQQQLSPQPRKPKTALWVTLASVSALMVGCVGGVATGSGAAPSPIVTSGGSNEPVAASTTVEAKRVHQVELRATAKPSGQANFYSDGSSNTEKVRSQWSKKIELEMGKSISLSVSPSLDAYSAGGDMKMTCEIVVDGKQVDRKEASGSSATAMCDYMGF